MLSRLVWVSNSLFLLFHIFYYFLVSFSSSGTRSLCLSSVLWLSLRSAFVVCWDVTQLFVSLSLSFKELCDLGIFLLLLLMWNSFPSTFFSVYLSVESSISRKFEDQHLSVAKRSTLLHKNSFEIFYFRKHVISTT